MDEWTDGRTDVKSVNPASWTVDAYILYYCMLYAQEYVL